MLGVAAFRAIADITFFSLEIVKPSWQPLLRLFLLKANFRIRLAARYLPMLRRTLFARLWAAVLSILAARRKNAEPSTAYLFILAGQ